MEEAHERIEALTHQNSEMKKRVVWNLSQSPRKTGKKQHHDEDDASSDEDSDWVPSEEHEKLRYHYSQSEHQLKRAATNVALLTEEKLKLEHLVLQLQSETETIGMLFTNHRWTEPFQMYQLMLLTQVNMSVCTKFSGVCYNVAPNS